MTKLHENKSEKMSKKFKWMKKSLKNKNKSKIDSLFLEWAEIVKKLRIKNEITSYYYNITTNTTNNNNNKDCVIILGACMWKHLSVEEFTDNLLTPPPQKK